MAIELRALGDPMAAEPLLNAALALEPNHPGALDQLATHYLLNEDLERSLAWSQQAIAAHPRRLAPYLRAGRALSELGRSDEALDVLEEARRLIGAHPEIRAAQVAVHMLDQNWAAARALLSAPDADTKRHVQLWTQHAALLLAIGDYDGAEAALPEAQLVNLQDSVRLKLFRGKIAEARWRLDDAVGFYREALALDPNDGWTHAELARVSLKVLDLDASDLHQRRMLELRSSSYLLRGKSLNVSQSMIGQLLDEFAIDRLLLDALRRIRTLDRQWQLDHLRRQVARNPGHTPSAIMLLIALRESGRLVQASAPANGTLARIPRRIFQYWDEPEPPSEIVELMNSWKALHPDFAYIRFDDAGARQFLSVHGLADALQAYRDAREPAQRADIFRLACLAIYGGVYADADDRCLAHVASFVPADAEFVAYQEHFGTLGNNFLAVTPEHPVIRLALQGACEALSRGDSDVLWLATGPGLLTRAFAQVLSRGT
jgi:mannosyltransferase OCH1-like enzyme